MFFKPKPEIKINKSNISSQSILHALEQMEDETIKYQRAPLKETNDKVILQVNDLVKVFHSKKHSKKVLDGVNLSIKEMENVAILGANGAGKTTLVEILVDIQKPTSGKIEYFLDFKKQFQEKIGIQFQDSSYPPAITTKEVLDFMVGIYGNNLNEDEFNALIKIFGIDEFLYKRASTLSGGQQQRLNVLLALVHKPTLIFLDELSTGLDISIRTRIKNFIYDYTQENNITIIVISHDMGEVQQLTKRICFLKNGNIIVDKSISDILDEFETLENFIATVL